MKPGRITSIGQLRPSEKVDRELDWFFNRAECDMGNQSNYLGMLGRHGPGSAMPSPEDAAEAAHRARRINDCLTAMDSADAGVLRCAYELRDWPVPLWDALGRLTGVVVRLACALDRVPDTRHELQFLERARASWLTEVCSCAPTDSTLLRLKFEAQARFARAHREYSRLRGYERQGGRSS
jgi:hypothetical protein